MRRHELKTWPSYFEAIQRGDKTFEVRRNDRDFAVGDLLVLQEWDPAKSYPGWTGREITVAVSYVMHGGRFGIDPQFCVLGIQVPAIDRLREGGNADR